MSKVEVNQGEIKVIFNEPRSGKLSFAELGINNEDINVESGLLRLVFDFEGIGDHDYFQTPTIEFFYEENMAETHWICEFNGETVLDKLDNHGRHENTLIVHAEFPQPANLNIKESYVHFFK